MLDIATPVLRIRVLAAVAEVDARVGRFEQAAATVARMRIEAENVPDTDVDARVRVLLSLAGTLSAAAPVSHAIGTARSIENRANRISALGAVAAALDRGGQPQRAAALFDAFVDSDLDDLERLFLLTALLAVGDWRRAREVVGRAPDRGRDDLQRRLVQALVEADECDEALAAAAEIGNAAVRDAAVGSVAEVLALRGDVERALALVRERIEGDHRRSRALRTAAQALHRSGHTGRAVDLLTEALEAAFTMPSHTPWTQEVRDTAVALAAAGHPDPAIAAVRQLGVPRELNFGLRAIADALGEAGDIDRAVEILESAPALTDPTPSGDPEEWDQTASMESTLAVVTLGLVKLGRADRALAHVTALFGGWYRCRGKVRIAHTLAEAGDVERANAVLDDVEEWFQSLDDPDPYYYCNTAMPAAQARLAAGRPDRALVLLDEIVGLIPDLDDEDDQYYWRGSVAKALGELGALDRAETAGRTDEGPLSELVFQLAQAGELDRAEAAAREITDTYVRAAAFQRVAARRIDTGDLDRAEPLINEVRNATDRIDLLISLGRAQAAAGNPGRAARTLASAEAAARARGGSTVRAQIEAGVSLERVVRGMVAVSGLEQAAGLFDAARTLAGDRPDLRVDVWGARGRLDRAVEAAQAVTDPFERCRALVRTALDQRLPASATPLAAAAGRAATLVEDADRQARAWALVAVAWVASGRHESAGAALERAASLARPGEAPAVTADLVRAEVALGRHGEALARAARTGDPVVLAAVAAALARDGEVDRALAVARSVNDPTLCEEALAEVAVALARAGSPAGALALLRPTGAT